MKNNREGLTVLIIGASSGIGKGVARRLAEDRANVVIGARRTGLIEALAEEPGPNVIAVTTDISSEDDIERIYHTATEKFGKIDVWINMAAVGLIEKHTDIPAEEWKKAGTFQQICVNA